MPPSERRCRVVSTIAPSEDESVKTTPLHDASAPVACTLSSEEVPDRLETFERIRTALQRLERTEHGLLLHFAADPEFEAVLRRFVIDEKNCCQFFGFDVNSEAGLTLQWDAPPTAAGLVDQLQSFFTGTEPARLVPGLL